MEKCIATTGGPVTKPESSIRANDYLFGGELLWKVAGTASKNNKSGMLSFDGLVKWDVSN
jgi:hypothetical protein